MPSSAAREERIRKALDAATRTIPGARWREDKPLLDTVVNMTEFPSVILGSFDPEFLSLPAEVLVTVMRDHQKYFALEDAERQAPAALPRCVEYRRAILTDSFDMATSACCAPVSTMRASSGKPIRRFRCVTASTC